MSKVMIPQLTQEAIEGMKAIGARGYKYAIESIKDEEGGSIARSWLFDQEGRFEGMSMSFVTEDVAAFWDRSVAMEKEAVEAGRWNSPIEFVEVEVDDPVAA